MIMELMQILNLYIKKLIAVSFAVYTEQNLFKLTNQSRKTHIIFFHFNDTPLSLTVVKIVYLSYSSDWTR